MKPHTNYLSTHLNPVGRLIATLKHIGEKAMSRISAHYNELTESGRLERDDEILDKAYQEHLDKIPKDYAMQDKSDPWWNPVDKAMASPNPPYEDKL